MSLGNVSSCALGLGLGDGPGNVKHASESKSSPSRVPFVQLFASTDDTDDIQHRHDAHMHIARSATNKPSSLAILLWSHIFFFCRLKVIRLCIDIQERKCRKSLKP